MPTGSRQLYRNFLNQVPAVAPLCVNDSLGSVNIGNDQWSRPNVQRRVKPDKPWRYPTSLGPYYEYQIRYPVVKTITTGKCGGNTRYYELYQSYQFSAVLIPSSPWLWNNILAQKVKDLRVNLATDLAEYREGVRAATDVAHALTRAVRLAKQMASSGSVRGAARAFARGRVHRDWRSVPSAWLGVNLAVLPAISTLSNVMDALNNPANARPIIRRIKFSKTEEFDDTTFYDQWGVKMTGHYLSRVKQWVKAFVELSPSKSLWADNFTVGNPAEWAWEATTLSFVVDWFIPIGNYLSNLDAYSGITGIWGTASNRTRTAVSGAKRPVDKYVETTGSILYTKYSRAAFTSPPALTIPKWDPHESVKKLTTALSLLATMTGRH